MAGKILFLDFDGVLNFVGITPWEPSRPRFEDEPIQQLNRIVEQVNCSIVITSAWRTQRPVKFWANLLRNYGFKYHTNIIGMTPSLLDKSRGDEIVAWREQHKHEDIFVVVDDTSDMDGVYRQFVETNPYKGLTKEDADEIIKLFMEEHHGEDQCLGTKI